MIVDFHAVAEIEKDSAEYNGFYYENGLGLSVPFEEGQTIIIKDVPNKRREVFEYVLDPQSYEQQPLLVNEVAYDENGDKYYFAPFLETDNVVKSFIDDVVVVGDVGTVTGESFEGVVIDVWVKYVSGGVYVVEKRAQGVTADLEGSGIDVDVSGGVVAIQLRVGSPDCPLFDESLWFVLNPPVAPLQGINYMQIGFDFKVS